MQRALKYPYTACEVFCCEVDALYTTLLGSEALTQLLLSIVRTTTPPDITLAGYFARVMRCLLVQRTADVMQVGCRKRLPAANSLATFVNLLRFVRVGSEAQLAWKAW